MKMNDYNKDVCSVGIMDGAFFVSRKELIDWINNVLKLNISRIEQCSNGAVYIQLLDMLFPNKSVLHRAKWLAKLEYECITNYKLIQSVFLRIGIKKDMDVDKLIKGKHQDTLEFLQWFKAFYERVIDYSNDYVINYDPVERRKICILGEKGNYKNLNNYLPDWAKTNTNNKNINDLNKNILQKKTNSRYSVNFDNKKGRAEKKKSVLTRTAGAIHTDKRINNINKDIEKKNNITNRASTKKIISEDSHSSSNYHNKLNNLEKGKEYDSIINLNKKLKIELENKNNEIEILRNKIKEYETQKKVNLFEKNFYYNKLRFIELLCNQTNKNYLLVSDINQIIYARENTYFHLTTSLKQENENFITEKNENNIHHENINENEIELENENEHVHENEYVHGNENEHVHENENEYVHGNENEHVHVHENENENEFESEFEHNEKIVYRGYNVNFKNDEEARIHFGLSQYDYNQLGNNENYDEQNYIEECNENDINEVSNMAYKDTLCSQYNENNYYNKNDQEYAIYYNS